MATKSRQEELILDSSGTTASLRSFQRATFVYNRGLVKSMRIEAAPDRFERLGAVDTHCSEARRGQLSSPCLLGVSGSGDCGFARYGLVPIRVPYVG